MYTDSEHRAEFIANMRAMADLLDSHPDMPVPYSLYLGVYPESIEEARKIRKGVFGWRKNTAETSPSIDYDLSIGGNEYGSGSVTYNLSVTKADTCKRVQVGTRHVEAHDVPIYEWDCKGADDNQEA